MYPAAHYCGTVLTLGQNVGLSYNYLGLLTIMPPVLIALFVLLRSFRRLAVADLTLLLSALLYLGVWSVLGNWSEPRIYIPFAMGLLPVSSVALARWVSAPPPAS
jgi:4-amino-4-deoxy-L-arabinose transferase-like glycosyltransferase